MNYDLVSTWLKLPSRDWPPDHYTLLGLDPREADLVRIEQCVYERMERVRQYQLSHPELATEVMNRLAQALVCLTDPTAKSRYDAGLYPDGEKRAASAAVERAGAGNSDPIAWLYGSAASKGLSRGEPSPTVVDWSQKPPPLRADWEKAPPPQRASWISGPPLERGNKKTVPSEKSGDWENAPPPRRIPLPEPTHLETLAETLKEEAVAESPAVPLTASPGEANREWQVPAARRPSTRRALYYRARHLRQLLWCWEQAGKYLGRPTRFVQRPSEATELIRHMQAIRELTRSSPAPLGDAGQPGYLVLSLARQEMLVPMFQTLLPSQREALTRDWQAGLHQLHGERQVLLHEVRGRRRHGPLRRVGRAFRAGLREHPSLLLLILALIALNVAFPELRVIWPRQALAVVGLFALRMIWWWDSLRPIRVSWSAPPAKRKYRGRPRVQHQAHSSGV